MAEKKAKQAKFVGDPNDDFSGPSRMVWKGLEFRKGKHRDVPDELVDKLRAHSHFVVEGDPDPTEDEEGPFEAPAPVAKKWSVVELRIILDGRGIKYTKRDGVEALKVLAEANGGLPEGES